MGGREDSEGPWLYHVCPLPPLNKCPCALSHPRGDPDAPRAHCPDGSFRGHRAPTPPALNHGPREAGCSVGATREQ